MKTKTIIITAVISILLFFTLYLWVNKEIWTSVTISLIIFGLNLFIAHFVNKYSKTHSDHIK